jgi:hypothetical protein
VRRRLFVEGHGVTRFAEPCRAQGDADANAGVILLVKQEEEGEMHGKNLKQLSMVYRY